MNTTINQASGVAEPDDEREPAPPNNLPDFEECARLIENAEFRARAAAGLEGAVLMTIDQSPEPTELHRFIHEYDDADSYRSAWFMHRLEKVVNEAAALATKPAAPAEVVAWNQALLAVLAKIKEIDDGEAPAYAHCREEVGGMFLPKPAALRTPTQAPSTGAVAETLKQFAESQRPLPADMAAILDANKWDLYATSAPPVVQPASPPTGEFDKLVAETPNDPGMAEARQWVKDEFYPASPAVEVASDVDEHQGFDTGTPALDDLLQRTWWMAKGPNNHDTVMAWMGSLEAVLPLITPPAAASSTEPASPVALSDSGDQLTDFQEGQWWVAELDALARSPSATDDQKRAVAVVHNFLNITAKLATPTPAVAVPGSLTDEQIVRSLVSSRTERDQRIAVEDMAQGGEMVVTLEDLRAVAALATTSTAAQPDPRDAEIARLTAIINTPQADDFLRAVSTEAEHQRQRWSSSHDAGKTPADWFWLVGYLAGKALHAHAAGNTEKAEHHIITTGAACANWHLAVFGKTDMRPGHEEGIDGAAAQPSSGVEP